VRGGAMAKAKTKKKSSAQGGSFKGRILVVSMLLTSIVALPTTVLLFIGMLPTMAARLGDNSKQKTRVLTVGFMNFAACFPFWYKLMQGGHKFDVALDLVMDPIHIIIMYSGALIGWAIEWGLSGIVSSMMVQKGYKRLETIKELQSELIAKWGPEVTGDLPLDRFGFPIENEKES